MTRSYSILALVDLIFFKPDELNRVYRCSPGVKSTSAWSMTPQWLPEEQQSTLRSTRPCRRRCEGLCCASPVRRTSRRPPARICPSQTGEASSKWATTARTKRFLRMRVSSGRWPAPAAYTPQTSAPRRSAPRCTETWCLDRTHEM